MYDMPMADEHPDLPALPGVRHRWVELPSLRMHIAEAGQGPPLLLLHGWPQHWWSFRLLIGELATRYHVIAPDLRGLGWSEAPAAGYSKHRLAEDIVELLDHEDIERAPVIAHDWGGYTAFLVALAHPERIERLLALDIPPPWRGRPSVRQLALPLLLSYQALLALPVVGEWLLRRGPGLVRGIIRLASGPRMRWTDEQLETYAQVLREPARAHASSLYYRTFLTEDLPASVRRGDRSGELRVPSLLLMGGASSIDRVLAPESSGALEVRRVPGAGHFLAEEAPEEVLAAAREWFGATAASPTR